MKNRNASDKMLDQTGFSHLGALCEYVWNPPLLPQQEPSLIAICLHIICNLKSTPPFR